jgi:hypothetical protein
MTTTLPRLPSPGTLRLEIDQDTLRLYSTEDDGGQTVDETYLVDLDSPKQIDDNCLGWALNAADCGGFLVLSYREITPVLYSLEGPSNLCSRLTLMRFDDGYQLHDLSVDPPRAIYLGTQTFSLSEEGAIRLATLSAEMCGYQPVCWRKTLANRWELLEREPVAQREPASVRSGWPRPEDLSLAVLALGDGAAIAAVVEGVSWARYVVTVLTAALGTVVLARWRRRPRPVETWSCDICYEQGIQFRCGTNAGDIDVLRDAHMKTFHSGRPGRTVG